MVHINDYFARRVVFSTVSIRINSAIPRTSSKLAWRHRKINAELKTFCLAETGPPRYAEASARSVLAAR
jgi:hypothetical protein